MPSSQPSTPVKGPTPERDRPAPKPVRFRDWASI
jgi:hypothetical protein